MIRVYILKTEKLQKKSFYDLTDDLPFGESEKARLTAIENSKHKWESLGGLIALERLLAKADVAPRNIIRSPDGKPFFDISNALPFGISHSHGISAAALGDVETKQIGFDIEIVDENYDCEKIAQRFFSEDELKKYTENDYSADTFFAIWTAKEALAKKDGQGLASVLSKKGFDTIDKVFCSTLKIDIDGQRLIISVCCDIPDEPIQIFIDSEEQS